MFCCISASLVARHPGAHERKIFFTHARIRDGCGLPMRQTDTEGGTDRHCVSVSVRVCGVFLHAQLGGRVPAVLCTLRSR